MARKQRTAERAKAIIDRAARMASFKPSFLDRRIGDQQMRTPGSRSKALEINSLPANAFERVGKMDVDPRHVISDQPTVSTKQVKGKIDQIASGKEPSVRLVQRPDGKFQMLDGNHGTTGYRALNAPIKGADVFRIKGQAPSTPKPVARPVAAAGKLPRGTGKTAAIVAGATLATAALGVLASSRAKAGEVKRAGLDGGTGDLKDAPDRLPIVPEIRELPANANMNKVAEHSFRVNGEMQTRAQERVAKHYQRAYEAADRVMARKGEIAGMKPAEENNSYGKAVLHGIDALNPGYKPGPKQSTNVEDRRGKPLPEWKPNTGAGAAPQPAKAQKSYTTPKALQGLLPKDPGPDLRSNLEPDSGDHLKQAEKVSASIAANVGTGIAMAGTAATAAISLASTGKMAQNAAGKVAQKAANRGPDGRFAKATEKINAAAARVQSGEGRIARVNNLLNNEKVVKAAKLSMPLFAIRAAYGAYTGYQKDGVKGAARGVADVATMGMASVAANHFAPMSMDAAAGSIPLIKSSSERASANAAKAGPTGKGGDRGQAMAPEKPSVQSFTTKRGEPGKKQYTQKQIDAFKRRRDPSIPEKV